MEVENAREENCQEPAEAPVEEKSGFPRFPAEDDAFPAEDDGDLRLLQRVLGVVLGDPLTVFTASMVLEKLRTTEKAEQGNSGGESAMDEGADDDDDAAAASALSCSSVLAALQAVAASRPDVIARRTLIRDGDVNSESVESVEVFRKRPPHLSSAMPSANDEEAVASAPSGSASASASSFTSSSSASALSSTDLSKKRRSASAGETGQAEARTTPPVRKRRLGMRRTPAASRSSAALSASLEAPKTTATPPSSKATANTSSSTTATPTKRLPGMRRRKMNMIRRVGSNGAVGGSHAFRSPLRTPPRSPEDEDDSSTGSEPCPSFGNAADMDEDVVPPGHVPDPATHGPGVMELEVLPEDMPPELETEMKLLRMQSNKLKAKSLLAKKRASSGSLSSVSQSLSSSPSSSSSSSLQSPASSSTASLTVPSTKASPAKRSPLITSASVYTPPKTIKAAWSPNRSIAYPTPTSSARHPRTSATGATSMAHLRLQVADAERRLTKLRGSNLRDVDVADTERLRILTQKWTDAAQEVIAELLAKTRERTGGVDPDGNEVNVLSLLTAFGIEPEMVRYDASTDDFF